MNKHSTITSLRWGCMPFSAGAGLHIGIGAERVFPNAVGIDPVSSEANLRMKLDRLRVIADGSYDFVLLGDALRKVREPRVLLAEAWRVLGEGGFLILLQPTPRAIEWILDIDSAFGDFVHHATMKLGGLTVDVVQKIRAGEGRHALPALLAEKTVAVCRPGGYGDALWAGSVLPALKREGYHVTVYVEKMGEEVLRHDPNIDRLIVTDEQRIALEEYGPFWHHEMQRYDRFINLTETVEKNLIAVPNDLRFFWPDAERRRIFDRSYIEAVHDLAGVPRKYAQRFYATPAEVEWAKEQVAGRRVAVIAVSGSTLPKYWPHVDELAAALVQRGLQVWILGDLRDRPLAKQPGVHVIGKGWTIREAMAFSLQAEVVIGQETAITNAVALEPMRKVVLLSHSSARQLTHYWKNTIALHGDAPCWPCHRIHFMQNGWDHCNLDKPTGTAKCQATISVKQVLAAVERPFVISKVA